jgi:uncharacterized repeat protein (TIGR04052 family)
MTTPSSPWRALAWPFILVAAACSSTDGAELFTSAEGSAVFAITDVDDTIASLEYAVNNRAGILVRSDSLRPDPEQTLRFTLDLPPALGYAITLTAHTASGQACTGTSQFDVTSLSIVNVSVELECSGGSGQANVTGTLVSCPSVAIASEATTLDVGASLLLATDVEGALDATLAWSASAAGLASTDGVTRFTCTEPGTVEIGLRASGGDCSASDSVVVTCVAPVATSPCDDLGSTCHVVEARSSAAHECHELGHGGDEAACVQGRAACIDTCGSALCSELASLCHEVDTGSGPIHDCHELGHAADAAACFAGGRECFDLCTRAHREPVTIRFAARVGAAPFACGSSYDGVGSSATSVDPQDFRFFVHDIRLVTGDGAEVPVEIDERIPWQARGAALLDFEDATGACLSGDAATNAEITGLVAPGDYTGIAFRVGVPESENHGDPAVQPAPLAAGSMTWGWLSGYKFLRAELGAVAGGGVLHLGSTACSGDPAAGSVACSRANRPNVSLTPFDAASDSIVADIAAVFAGVDLSTSTLCHSSGTSCAPMFDALGVDLGTGDGKAGQGVFGVSP